MTEGKKIEVKEIDNYVGHKLRNKRQKVSLTLAEVAVRLGVSHQQVQKYERGQSRVSASTLYQLSMLFGVTPDYFFEGYSPSSHNKSYSFHSDIISPNRRKSLNVLIVEDDPADELLFRKALEACDEEVNVFCIHDGARALDFLKSRDFESNFPRPDIILMDLNIPRRDGHEVLKEIKRDREILDIPVIIISNGVSIKEMMSIYKCHAAGYVCKSFDYEVFQDSIVGLVRYWSSVVVLPSTATEA